MFRQYTKRRSLVFSVPYTVKTKLRSTSQELWVYILLGRDKKKFNKSGSMPHVRDKQRKKDCIMEYCRAQVR